MASGCGAGLVNAGGDLRVFGQRNEPIFVRRPGGALTNIELCDAALAVSDTTAQQRPPEHQGYYIRSARATNRDGRHGRRSDLPSGASTETPLTQPAVEYATSYAVVVAKTAVVADALAKCVLLCPSPVATRVLQEFGATTAL